MNLRAVAPIPETVGGSELRSVQDHPLLDHVEILSIKEGGTLVDCVVPAHLIDYEEVPVKEEWAESLAKQMRESSQGDGDSGQLSSIILGVIDGLDRFKIIDGFHRDAALRINSEEFRTATVRLVDWNTLYNVRIFTAKDHPHVRFSRVVQWIREAWQFSDLSDKLTVEQAVLLYEFGTSGARLDLDPEDVELARAWVEEKEDKWGLDAMTIREHLKVAEHVDPALVHATREKKNPHVLLAPTQAILKVFAKHLPDNFTIQNLVMDTAKTRNLKGPDVRGLCELVKDCDNLAAAQELVDEIDWDTWVPAYEETKTRALRRAHDPRHKGAAVLQRAFEDIDRVTERVDLAVSRSEEITPEMRRKIQEAHAASNELYLRLHKLGRKLANLSLSSDNGSDTYTDLGSHPADKSRARSAPIRSTSAPIPASPITRPVLGTEPETTVLDSFSQQLRDYLNGKSDDYPLLTTKSDVVRAERVMKETGFSGHPELLEDVREEIRKARANFPK